MTYALGWKSDSEVFLAADTALTSPIDAMGFHTVESSFGQEHVLNDQEEERVEERVVKLFLRNNIGITFAGSYALAIRVAASFYEKIEQEENPREALNWALFANPIPKGKDLQLVVAFHDGAPRLISFNVQHDGQIREDEQLVQIGNPLARHRQLTETWINDVILTAAGEPALNLSALLGILQSYNLFSPQMERGIGGAFCGLYIDQSGGKWQPDILFVEYGGAREKNVSTCFRHDCLVINSPTIGQSRCLCSFVPPQTQAYMYGQALKAVVKGKRLHRNEEYEYVVFLSVEHMTVTLIEMARHTKHALIWLKHIKDGAREGTQMSFFPGLREIASRTETGLTIIPYVEPNIKHIPDNRITRRDISYD